MKKEVKNPPLSRILEGHSPMILGMLDVFFFFWGELITSFSASQLRLQDGGWKKFSEAQLRTVLNVCGVQSTSTWTKEELVPGPFVFFLWRFFLEKTSNRGVSLPKMLAIIWKMEVVFFFFFLLRVLLYSFAPCRAGR